MGGFIALIHAIGALKPFKERPVLNITNFGDEPIDYLLKHNLMDLFGAYSSVKAHALESVSRCFERVGTVKNLRLHGDCYPGNILWTDDTDPISLILMTAVWGRQYRICGCCFQVTVPR